MARGRTIWRIVLAITAVLVAVAIGYWLHFAHVMRDGLEKHEARGRAAVAAHHDKFMEDQRLLAALSLFAQRAGKRDAGPLIGPRVRWMLAVPQATSPALVESMALNRSALDKLGNDWMHAGPEVWAGVDTSWMARLSEYDLWDVEQNSVPPDSRLFSDPEPDTTDLWGWAQLRIAKGIHDGAAGQALAEVQELARLCFTTERVGTEIAGLGILSFVRGARVHLGSTPDPTTEREGLGRIQRAIYGAIAFARLETPAAYEGDFSRIAIGRCAALHDGLHIALLHRVELRDARPADYERLERLLAGSDCRLTWLRRRWALPDDERLTQPDRLWDRVKMRWIPGSRHFWGQVGIAIGEQDWFKQCDNQARATP